ncbi:MAG: undecaprenyldiphospho-muramoylpentapeptide beta-N-acetylglucosaminyltransferase [Saprospiraceae bacterium]|nr:undecaprenyldiphospho-muramoylpentapeptide beta-N-acetylglucosaminyltransferase [Saprospiraceae bacterium]
MRRFIISGGGTGGHVFPALAIGRALLRKIENAEILFVGAEGKMEMEKVPQAGFKIIGLPISGLQRSLTWKNVLFPFRLLRSYLKARRIVRSFKPDVAIGVGGYASWPTLYAASRKGIKTVIQEQNSYAGLTNKQLAKSVDLICVAYHNMDRYFPKNKIVFTGNPIRADLLAQNDRKLAWEYFGLKPDLRTILLFGGSLGAGTLNEAMDKGADLIGQQSDVQIIWQVGSFYAEKYSRSPSAELAQVKQSEFIDRMDLAYLAADLVICRAGALTISELCLLSKPSILVPSPNVAEDHQTKNAEAMVKAGAARIIRDGEAPAVLIEEAIQLVHDEEKLKTWSYAAGRLGRPRAGEEIVNEILKLNK